MNRPAFLALAAVAGLALPAAASAAPRAITIDPDAPSKTWTGAPAPAANVTFYEGNRTKLSACGTTPRDYCDDTLVHFTGEGPYDASDITFRIDGFQHSDYDLRVYASDATGAEGEYLGDPTGDGAGLVPQLPTFWGDGETKTVAADPGSWFLVRVVYFTVAGHEGYNGKVSWAGTPLTEPEPESESGE